MKLKDEGVWDVRITLNDIFVAVVSLPMVFIFFILSYQLINQAFVNPEVREDIESYIAVLGILSGPAYMAISRFFDRWNAEQEERVEAKRRQSKTEDDLIRATIGHEDAISHEELESSLPSSDQSLESP
jgi:hypothetical protein